MCRWIAYTGQPIFIDQVVTVPEHSLVRQSFDTRMRFSKNGTLLNLNGDGFGIGWYTDKSTPGLYKDEQPAWSSKNLDNISEQIKAHIFFAHIRAATTGAVQRSNCHPFKHENWLFQHNGDVSNFLAIKQELHSAIAPELYSALKGDTDSEVFFLLALTYGLQDNPKAGFQKMVRRVKEACENANIESAINLSCSLSDGETLYTLRYCESEQPCTQFYSTNFDLSPTSEIPKSQTPNPGKYVVVVSEPLDEMDSSWKKVPENTFATIKDGQVSFEKFM